MLERNPFIKSKYNTVQIIMLDVILALLPMVMIAYVAFGMKALVLIGTSVLSCVLADGIFSSLFLKKYKTFLDGSAIVTGLLLAFTISPLTPWYVVAFGGISAILFGKIVWGGLGKNRFNPALVGREFMALFFASIMTSSQIWKTNGLINVSSTSFFPGLSPFSDSYFSGMIYKTSGALGEYSIVAIALGGLYLLVRKRISWEIPLALLVVFISLFWVVEEGDDLKFSLAGVLLGTLFMATDMPSSPTNSGGKIYYGAMIGLVTFLLILGDVRFEYMSYSILILNGFSPLVSELFRPRVWGRELDWKGRIEKIFFLTLAILGVTLAVLSLYYYHMVSILVYVYIVYIILKFSFSYKKRIEEPI